MDVVRCENGHFYDADVYGSCPHCTEKEKEEGKEKKCGGFFARFRKAPGTGKEKEPELRAAQPLCAPTELISAAPRGESCVPVQRKVPTEMPAELPSVQKEAPAAHAAAPAKPYAEERTAEHTKAQPEVHRAEPQSVYPRPQPEVHPSEAQREYPRPQPQREEIAADERTVGFFCESPDSVPPCVGWLVGLTGACRGISFELKPGGNAIGRGAQNRVAITLDNRVSRDAHAYIVYEPRKREYIMNSGKGNGISYVNGEVILHRTVLSCGDIIEIGGGSYLFVPLCSDTFSWESYPEFRPICREGVPNLRAV